MEAEGARREWKDVQKREDGAETTESYGLEASL